MRYVAGLDGGGTKTDCIIADESGRVLGVGAGGMAIHLYVEEPRVAASIQTAIRQALVGVPGEVGAGLAALEVTIPIANWEGVQAWVAEVIRVGSLKRASEQAVCRAASLQEGPVLLLVSGTGSFAYGWAGPGRDAFAGGKGPLIGDDGSGYDIGLQALKAWVRSLDGRGPATCLRDLLSEELGLTTMEQMVHRVYVDPMERHEIAALAPLVDQAAVMGDEVAHEILARAAQSLVTAGRAAVRGAGLEEPFAIAFFGGVLQRSRILRGYVERGLREHWLQAGFVYPELRPVHGAVALALGEIGIEITRDVADRLRRTTEELLQRRIAEGGP